MSGMNRILRTIWGAWGIAIFGLVFSVYTPVFLFIHYCLPARYLKSYIAFSYKWVPYVSFFLYGIRLKINGEEKIDTSRNYIFISNHQSILDIYANAAACPMSFKYLAKKEASKIPILGITLKYISVFVDRNNFGSRKGSFHHLIKSLEAGESVLIYPEGTRNRTQNPLKSFYDGAFRLAILTGTPIAVQTLVNSGNLSSPFRKFDLRPGTIYAYWREPIETQNLSLEDVPQLKSQVREMMTNRLLNS